MDIVLTTFNASFIHAAFGLRYLYANLGALQPRATIVELDLTLAPVDAVERLLALEPRVVGFGVYIWNAERTLATVELLKRVRPDVRVVVGGPEVSHELDDQPLCALADHVVIGEGDLAFAALCQRLLDGAAAPRVVHGGTPDLTALALPYALYDDRDLAHRVVYVEASRGCPFRCAFCLSALDTGVRRFDEAAFLGELAALHDRGLRTFKFVDRTFNLSIPTCERILRFFLDRLDPALFVHFELVPDRLPAALKALLVQFPPGALQFELGVQTLNPEVAARIDRRSDLTAIEANFRWLRAHTGAHLHADLIIGLPGESMASFADGFNRLRAWGPQEIQVGVLKRLRGTPITALTERHAMVYSPRPPYEVLQTDAIPFDTMMRLKRFARHWGLLANEGHYRELLALLLPDDDVFDRFFALSDRLTARFGRTHAIAAPRLVDALLDEATAAGVPAERAGRALVDDLIRTHRLPLPDRLRPYATDAERRLRGPARPRTGHERQAAHGSR